MSFFVHGIFNKTELLNLVEHSVSGQIDAIFRVREFSIVIPNRRHRPAENQHLIFVRTQQVLFGLDV